MKINFQLNFFSISLLRKINEHTHISADQQILPAEIELPAFFINKNFIFKILCWNVFAITIL